MQWTFTYNHNACEQCKALELDAILIASAESRDEAGYAANGHGATGRKVKKD
jgi:hypothetical protein